MPIAAHIWENCVAVVRPALRSAPTTFLADVNARLAEHGIQEAVTAHGTAALFDWIIGLVDRQGISNAAAISFAARHEAVRWDDLRAALSHRPVCSKLRSYWHLDACGYRKDAQSCAHSSLLPSCCLPRLPARKGTLNQAAFGLALFVRDVCADDIVEWIDARLAAADASGSPAGRAERMRASVLWPLVEISGTGPKVWAMILAELLLGGDPSRERWVTTGASLVAVDSLVHAFLHRTGILCRLDTRHVYGNGCHGPGGCVKVIEQLAARIDVREFNSYFSGFLSSLGSVRTLVFLR